MTTPPADHGGQQDTPRSQPQPQSPPPYGQAGPAGYPGLPSYPGGPAAAPSPPPYYPPGPAAPRSGSALTALVLGILGLLSAFFGAILAIIFGIVALVRIRKTGSRGRAMAITGIVLGVIWTGLTALFVALGIHATSYGSIGRLRAGACFDNTQPGQVSTQVYFLSSCAQPHNGQVVGTFALPGTAWPGSLAVRSQASAGCAAMLGSVLQQHALSNGVGMRNYTPDEQAWSSGDRSAACVLLDPSTRHAGSMFARNGHQ